MHLNLSIVADALLAPCSPTPTLSQLAIVGSAFASLDALNRRRITPGVAGVPSGRASAAGAMPDSLDKKRALSALLRLAVRGRSRADDANDRDRGIPAPRGGQWQSPQVMRLLDRLGL
jgi:hypothetical protein